MPGFGAPGLVGIFLELAAIGVTYYYHGSAVALVVGLILLSLIAIVLSIALRSAAKGRFAKSKIVLNNVEGSENGFVASEDMKVFIGREGEATGTLRPAGIADFDGVRLNVVSEGDFIPAGTRVRIISAEGSRIVVKKVS
jgi:membrane-bound ClpP family serine protease